MCYDVENYYLLLESISFIFYFQIFKHQFWTKNGTFCEEYYVIYSFILKGEVSENFLFHLMSEKKQDKWEMIGT